MLILSLISLQTVLTTNGNGHTLVFGIVMVFMAEIVVDWVKHAFIAKFNRIDASVYEKYLKILSRDSSSSRAEPGATLDHTHQVSRRLGLVSLPLAAVILRMLSKFLYAGPIVWTSPIGAAIMIVTFACLLAIKVDSSSSYYLTSC